MALQLKTPHPARGAQWVREAFRLFGRRPLAFTGLFAVFLFAALMTVFVPYLGGVLQMMMLPLLSLGFMVASLSALNGGPVQPGQYIEPLTADPVRRRNLLVLCAAYGVAAVALLLLSNTLADGKLMELQRLMGSGDANPEEINALAADRGVFVGTLTAIFGATLLSVPFWHAPALVHWGGQGIAQALFSSTLAVWRAKGAFLVYALTWAALIAGFGLITAVVLGLLGVPALAGALALPAGLMFSTVFYVSLIFSFNDSFGQTTAEDAPAA
jgi:hypothetical protein